MNTSFARLLVGCSRVGLCWLLVWGVCCMGPRSHGGPRLLSELTHEELDEDLWRAIRFGMLSYVDSLLGAGATPLDSLRNEYGDSPLHIAVGVTYSGEAALQALIDRGALIEVHNADGDTPLHWAVIFGHPSAVRYLLAMGANPQARNREGETPRALVLQSIRRDCLWGYVPQDLQEMMEILPEDCPCENSSPRPRFVERRS